MSVKNFSDLLADNENDLDNLRGQSFQDIIFETVEDFLDGSSIGGVIFESPILAFGGDNSEVLENSIIQLFNAIIRNAISTYGQVIDFEETQSFDRMLLTKVPWVNCEFLNFDRRREWKKYFFGTFDKCKFDNIDFTPRDLRMTHCEVQNSLMSGDFNKTWIAQCVLEKTYFKHLEFGLYDKKPMTNVLFDRMYFYYKHSNSKFKDKYVTPGYTMTEIYNCHFDKIQLRRTKDYSDQYNESTVSPEIRLMFPYKGLETCSFTVLLLSNETLKARSKWLYAALPSQFVRPNAVPKRKRLAPKESPYSSFIDFCDKEDLWYFMGFRREDLLRAKKLTFAIMFGFKGLFIDASSHKEKEVLNLELMSSGYNDTVIEDCKFQNMEINLCLTYLHGGKAFLIGSTFENCTITIEKGAKKQFAMSDNKEVLALMYCTFVNCTIRGGTYEPDSHMINETIFKDCAFEDATLKLNFHPNIILEGTVTYDETSRLINVKSPKSIEELGFIKKG